MTRIAIVDDDDGLRRGLAALLGSKTREIVVYETGEVFLDTVAEDAIDLAVVDLRLPGVSGLEVLRELQPLDFPVVMISAAGNIRAAVDAIKLGASDFLEKPFKPEELERLIDRMLTEPRASDGGDRRQGPGAGKTCLSGLTPREKEVAMALAEGLTNKEIARRLDCSPRTIEVHRSRAFHKLGVSNIVGLIRKVDSLGH